MGKTRKKIMIPGREVVRKGAASGSFRLIKAESKTISCEIREMIG